MQEAQIKHYDNLQALSSEAARWIVEWAKACIEDRGRFTWVLSGGKTPKGLYDQMASPPLSRWMPWPHTHLFWGDERCVPPGHNHSNFALAFRTLISRVPAPPQNVHRILAEKKPPEEAARAYEQTLRSFFGSSEKGDLSGKNGKRSIPSFDLILLGIGNDGHTASLFPGDRVLEEKNRWVLAVFIARSFPQVPRITLTLPIINQARSVMFMVVGAGKGRTVRKVLEGSRAAVRQYPAARIRPRGNLTWWMDEAVYAAALTHRRFATNVPWIAGRKARKTGGH